MKPVRLRPAARADLANVWEYTANTWGVAQADSYLADIDAEARRIADFPERHPTYASRHGEFRKAASGEHSIFYLVEPDLIDVVRVLHKSMDFDEQLG